MDNGTSEKLKMIQADLRLAFDEIGKKHHIVFNTGTLSYNTLYFTMPLKGRFLDAQNSTEEADKEEFELYAGRFGLTGDMFGKLFTIEGKTYKICGIRPKARKYHISAKALVGGKTFIFEVPAVLRHINKAVA